VNRAAIARAAAPWMVALVVIALALGLRASCSPRPLERLAPAPFAAGDPSGSRAYSGSLHLPRGGPYQFYVYAPGRAHAVLQVGATRVVPNGNRVPARVLLDAGVAPIRVAGPPGTILLWHPPGRRGDLEYIPASSLSPEPPERARFEDPGTARADAAAAWAVVLALAAALLFTLRARIAAVPGAILLGTGAVFVLALVVRLVDLGGGGQTWDEDTYWSSGRDYVQNLVRGDLSDGAWIWNYEHPPVSKYLAGLGGLWQDGFGGARAMSALVMAFACATLVAIGARLDRPATGVAAGVIAALTPHLVAHGQIIGHEAPTALVWALAWWTSLRVWDPRDGAEPTTFRAVLPRLVVCGVVLGVAIMVRYVNVLIAPAMGATILLRAPRPAQNKVIGWGLAVIPAVAIITAIVLWPRLWSSPLVHLASSWAKLKGTHSGEPFFGVVTTTPPRWYFLAYLGATAPVGILVASLGGVVAWARAGGRGMALAVALAWLVAPLGVMYSPVRQDGIRYVIPCLLVFALLAGAGVVALGARLGAAGRSRLVAWPIAAMALYLAITCWRIHPYYLDYYGEHVGGPAAVARAKRFEVGWWGEGLEEAIAYVNTHAAKGDRVHRECVEPGHLTWFRGDLWETVRDPAQARWIVHYHPSWSGCRLPPGATRVHTVAAQGAPLAYVYRVDPAPTP
jgi:4-amino-4-deoxy-L-arabinose transferase-like glycosyltransferase